MTDRLTISRVLRECGIPANLNGYDCIITAIEMCLQDKSLTKALTKRLYPDIAKVHQTTPTRAERNIRHSIETAFLRADTSVLKKIFW